MIKYKIVEAHPEQHSIVVRFYSDVVTEASVASQLDEAGKILRGRTDYNINLPVPAPIGEDLHKLISSHAPVSWLKMQEAIADSAIDTSLVEVLELVGVEFSVMPPVIAPVRFDIGEVTL